MDFEDNSFRVSETQRDDTCVLRLEGELDLAAIEPLQARFDALAERRQPTRLDLEGLSFIDSTGIACISQAVRRARETGWPLTVDRTLQGQVQRLIELVDGESLFWPASG